MLKQGMKEILKKIKMILNLDSPANILMLSQTV